MIREEIDREPVAFTEDKAPLPRDRRLQVLPPKRVVVEKTGKGVRVTVTDRAHENIDRAGTSAVAYHVHWAQTVDATSEDGVAAGFARSTLLAPALPAPGFDGGVVTGEFTDAKFATGYFYVTGVDELGRRSEPTHPVRIGSGSGGSIPDDLQHFQASESGEVHNGSTLSAVAYSFQMPERLNDLFAVQFWYENYPNLNQVSAGESIQRVAGPGGSQTGKLKLPVARRVGAGTISIAGDAVTGVGTNFLTLAAAGGGDYLEVFGYRALIGSVTSNTSMTLAAAWPAGNPAVSAAAIWQVIGSVTIYAVSIGPNGERRDDVTGAPSQTVVLDGELSTPNAPTVTATALGNVIRLEVSPPIGTELARLLLYKATGAGVTFSKATCSVIHSWEIDRNNASPTFQHDDSDFTLYQREQNTVFSYFATAVNARDQESSASTRVEGTARLDTGADTGPQDNAREIARNLFFNAHFTGPDGTSVDDTDAEQDDNMGGAGAPAGHYYWDGQALVAASLPGWENDTEVVLAMTALLNSGTSILSQRIDAWDNATAANRRIPKGKHLTFQIKIRSSGGQPNGTLAVEIRQYDTADAESGNATWREREADDDVVFTANSLDFDASNIDTDFQLVVGTCELDQEAETAYIIVRIGYASNVWNGINVNVTQPMLSFGDTPPQWTAEMPDPLITYGPPAGGTPIPPGHFPDRDGGYRDIIPLP